VVLNPDAVTRGSGSRNKDKERNIQKWFVEPDVSDGVTLLRDDLFYDTGAAGVIAVLAKSKFTAPCAVRCYPAGHPQKPGETVACQHRLKLRSPYLP